VWGDKREKPRGEDGPAGFGGNVGKEGKGGVEGDLGPRKGKTQKKEH